MLTAAGCESRRRRLFERLRPNADWAIVADPRHVTYLTNLHVDPISYSAGGAATLLLIERGGRSTLVTDTNAARRAKDVFVDRLETVQWYNHVDSVIDRRRAAIDHFVKCLPAELPESIAVERCAVPVELARHLVSELSSQALIPLDDTLNEMRAVKDPDEIDLLRRCVRAIEAGHARSWEVVRPGVAEREVYREMASACIEAAGHPVIVYGDFASGPRTWLERGGPPTGRRLERGDLMILDFSVVIHGYRGDFTNTMAVGGEPTPEQRRIFEACEAAMRSGEQSLRAGIAARSVWEAVNRPLEAADRALRLPHHAGHGIGLAHPEPPILVPKSSDTLAAGNVITLEPGAYVDGVGGVRIENNYLITDAGFERLSRHTIGLTRA